MPAREHARSESVRVGQARSGLSALSCEKIVFPDGVRAGTIRLRDGKIASIGAREAAAEVEAGHLVLDDRLVLLPGFVDTHVHLNDPRPGEPWEGFEAGTRAAAAGGITTVVDMPLNSLPVTTSVEALEAKVAAATRAGCMVDFGLWGGVVPGNAGQLAPLHRAGCVGFKCFLTPSGLDEFPATDAASLRIAMEQIARLGSVLLVHAELPEFLEPERLIGRSRSAIAYASSRPARAELEAVRLVLDAARATACRVHIVHVSASECLAMIQEARKSGLRVTAETCPHYLALAAEEIPEGGTVFKCAPPIRNRRNAVELWEGLRAGVLDAIVTDHSPCPPAMKCLDDGDFERAWGGIASLQVSASVVWTAAAQRGFELFDLARWMAAGPAKLAGLAHLKGEIAVGLDADFACLDPECEWVICGRELAHRHAVIPYEGMRVRGRVVRTILRGHVVYDGGRWADQPPGRWIQRTMTQEQNDRT